MLFRIRDLLFSALLLILFSPIMLLAAILIKLMMPGPILFVQERIGRYGKPFKIYKFRSMVVNTENNGITLSKDERITPMGKILRLTKIDEFPQLFNILKGDMSFVGPRPDLPGYYDTLEGEYRNVLLLRPGLTGLDSMIYPYEEKILNGQPDPVKFYNEVLWPHKVRLNYWYWQHRSFGLDVKIVINTLSQILISKIIFPFPEIK